MKRSIIFLLAAATITAVVSCQKEPQEEETKYSLSVEPVALNFEATGAEPQTVTVTAEDVTWTAALESSADTWLNVTFDTETITVSVEDNTETTERTARIAVVPDNAEAETAYITVNQSAAEEYEPEYMEMTSGCVTYYGENFLYNTNGNAEYFMFLFNGNIDYEQVDFGNSFYWSSNNADGTALVITSFCSLAEDFNNPMMDDGTYSYSDEILPMTFRGGEGDTDFPQYSYVATYENGTRTASKFITGGEYTLEIEGDVYTATFNLILEDGTEAYFKYDGELLHDNLATPPFSSELTVDINLHTEDIQAAAVISTFEDSYDPDLAIWELQFLGEGLYVNDGGTVDGIGNFVQLKLYAPLSEGFNRLPEGTYDIMDGFLFGAYSAPAGNNDPIFGSSGCFIFSYTDAGSAFGPMSSGTITVSYPDSENYRIVIDAMDDNDHFITMTYEGSLQRADLQ